MIAERLLHTLPDHKRESSDVCFTIVLARNGQG